MALFSQQVSYGTCYKAIHNVVQNLSEVLTWLHVPPFSSYQYKLLLEDFPVQASIFIQKINICSYLIRTEILAYLDQRFHFHKYSAQSSYLKSFNQR